MSFSDNKMEAERIGKISKIRRKPSAEIGRKKTSKITKRCGRALEIGAKIAGAAVTRNPKAALSAILNGKIFYHTMKELYLGRII